MSTPLALPARLGPPRPVSSPTQAGGERQPFRAAKPLSRKGLHQKTRVSAVGHACDPIAPFAMMLGTLAGRTLRASPAGWRLGNSRPCGMGASESW